MKIQGWATGTRYIHGWNEVELQGRIRGWAYAGLVGSRQYKVGYEVYKVGYKVGMHTIQGRIRGSQGRIRGWGSFQYEVGNLVGIRASIRWLRKKSSYPIQYELFV